MPIDVVMPQMGESIFEGTITKWLKKAGDAVEKDEPLFEISTDKVDAEIPSPVAGVLSEIKVKEGATVEINTVVAVVSERVEAALEARVHEAPDGSSTPLASMSKPSGQLQGDGAPVSGATDVVMPQLGESIFEGTITKWLKSVGDAVEKDELLFEISTDKVDAEIPAPVAGMLTEIKVQTGATVGINTVVAVIGGALKTSSNAANTKPAHQEVAPSFAAKPESPASNEDAAAPQTAGRLRSSPLVRRIAQENNLDLHRIAGTGSAGRITKEDILKHLSERGAARPAAGAQPAAAPKPAASVETLPPSDLPGQVVPLSRMRAIIADRMVESMNISPHVYSVYKIDMTRIVRLRERERARFEQKHGVKLTFMPFIAAAAIEALRRHPVVNASLKNGSIYYHANIHLGIAVALDWGLIVPVVKQAETLSFAALARTMSDLADRARGKKLKPEEATGSTFTLTNSGVFGGEFGTPIINQPESAILGVGGLFKEPAVVTAEDGTDSVAIRSFRSEERRVGKECW